MARYLSIQQYVFRKKIENFYFWLFSFIKDAHQIIISPQKKYEHIR